MYQRSGINKGERITRAGNSWAPLIQPSATHQLGQKEKKVRPRVHPLLAVFQTIRNITHRIRTP